MKKWSGNRVKGLVVRSKCRGFVDGISVESVVGMPMMAWRVWEEDSGPL